MFVNVSTCPLYARIWIGMTLLHYFSGLIALMLFFMRIAVNFDCLIQYFPSAPSKLRLF